MKWSMDAKFAAMGLALAATAGDMDKAEARLQGIIAATCGGCHKVHREKVEGGFKIK